MLYTTKNVRVIRDGKKKFYGSQRESERPEGETLIVLPYFPPGSKTDRFDLRVSNCPRAFWQS